MKYLFLLLAMAATVEAQRVGVTVTSTNPATTLSFVVLPASNNEETPVVTFVNANSDTVASYLFSYLVTAQAVAALTNTPATNFFAVSTNGGIWTTGQVVILRHMQGDVYEKLTNYSAWGTSTTNAGTVYNGFVLGAAPVGNISPGDILYGVTTNGAPRIRLGATNVNLSGNALLIGQPGMPLMLEVNGTSAATISAATCVFMKPGSL